MCKHKYIYVLGKWKPYSICNFGSSENSGGRYPDKLLLSRRLQVPSWRLSMVIQMPNMKFKNMTKYLQVNKTR